MDNLQTQADNPLDNPTGVLAATEFPHRTNTVKFTPQQLIDALRLWASNGHELDDVLKSCNICPVTYYKMKVSYPEICKAEDYARTFKADQWAQKAVEAYNCDINNVPGLYEEDKHGMRHASHAVVTYHNHRANLYTRLAATANPAKYGQKQQIETTNRNLNVNLSAPIEGRQALSALESFLSD